MVYLIIIQIISFTYFQSNFAGILFPTFKVKGWRKIDMRPIFLIFVCVASFYFFETQADEILQFKSLDCFSHDPFVVTKVCKIIIVSRNLSFVRVEVDLMKVIESPVYVSFMKVWRLKFKILRFSWRCRSS